MAVNRCVMRWLMKQLREGVVEMSCGRLLYVIGKRMEKVYSKMGVFPVYIHLGGG